MPQRARNAPIRSRGSGKPRHACSPVISWPDASTVCGCINHTLGRCPTDVARASPNVGVIVQATWATRGRWPAGRRQASSCYFGEESVRLRDRALSGHAPKRVLSNL